MTSVLVLWTKCCESLEANHLDLGQCSWIWKMKWISWPGNDIIDSSYLNFSVFEKRLCLHVSSRTLVKKWKRNFKYEIQYILYIFIYVLYIYIYIYIYIYNIHIYIYIYIYKYIYILYIYIYYLFIFIYLLNFIFIYNIGMK